MSSGVVVLDASVGAKWFREEAGTAEAAALLERHLAGDLVLAVPWLFVYECMSVVTRHFDSIQHIALL